MKKANNIDCYRLSFFVGCDRHLWAHVALYLTHTIIVMTLKVIELYNYERNTHDESEDYRSWDEDSVNTRKNADF